MSSASNQVYIRAHRRSFVSQSGLIEVLKSVKEHGMPKAVSRRTLKRTRQAELMDDTPVGKLFTTLSLEMEDGSFKSFPALNPFPLLWLCLHRCSQFAEFFHGILESVGPTHERPMKVALYCDEVLPGNALKVTNHRKLLAWYWSWLEYGRMIHMEGLWLHIFVLRASQVKKIKGGAGQILSKLIELFFNDPFDMRLGIRLEFPGPLADRFLFGRMGVVVADEVALKQVFSFKGSSGTMCCFKCSNLVSHVSRLDIHDPTSTLQPSCVTDLSGCHQHTDDSVHQNAMNLHARSTVGTKKEFEVLQQSCGLTYQPGGVLWNPRFPELCGGLISIAMFDWMHVMVVGGTWNSETGLMFDSITHQISNQSVDRFLQSVHFPTCARSKGTISKHLFEKRGSGPFSCSASEALTLYPCLRALLEDQLPNASTNPACQSYFAICEILDILQQSRSKDIDPATLQAKIEKHLGYRLIAHGPASFQPKVHYQLHFSQQLRFFGRLIACWCHERKHKELKRYANQAHAAKPGTSWEKGLLEEVILVGLLALEEFDIKDGIQFLKEHDASQQLVALVRSQLNLSPLQPVAVKVSEEALVNHELFGKGDCVQCIDDDGEGVGELWFHVKVQPVNQDPVFVSVVSPWQSMGRNKFRIMDDPCIVLTSSLKKAMPFVLEGRTARVIP